jgi:hypothetical protein
MKPAISISISPERRSARILFAEKVGATAHVDFLIQLIKDAPID